MNRGHVLQSTPVQQMMGGNPNWWSINNNMRSPPLNTNSSSLLPPPPSTFFSNQYVAPLAPPSSCSWQDNSENHQLQLPADSWSQLLLGGLVCDQEEQILQLHGATTTTTPTNNNSELVKQEKSCSSGGTTSFAYGTTSNWSEIMGAASSPKSSCVSTISTTNILDFSSKKSDARHPPPDHSSEYNSNATGGSAKKARIQLSSTQSTFKVRKEKLGDRITALHQLVSPFGKTDTASVLLEAIGYIRFLESQIEALSLPYMGSGSQTMRNQHCFYCGEVGHTVPCCPWTNLPCGYNNCGHTMILQWSRKPWSFGRRFLTCKGQPRCKHFRWIDYNSTSEHQNTGLSNDITEVGSSGGQTQNPVKVTVEEKGKKITLEGNVDEVQGERNCLFPEDPGKLLNDNCMKRKGVSDHQDSYEEAKNDLRSRGLCLVPLSCTLQVGSENGADYWAPTLGGGGYQ